MNATIPVTQCRCCHQPMRTDFQERISPKPPMVLVTCENEYCGLQGYTFSAEGYSQMNFAPYLKMSKREEGK